MELNSHIDFFNGLGKKYEEAFGHDAGLHDFIKGSLARLPAGASILELGSGTGRPLSEMAVKQGFNLHGIDFSPVMIEIAQRQVPGASFREANIFEFEPSGATLYDGVFSMFSLFHFSQEDMDALAHRLASWLKPGGFLFIGTMVADDFVTTPDMFDADGLYARGIKHGFMGRRIENLLYSEKGWRAFLNAAGFKIVETDTVPFQAPPEAECDVEPHYYITAQKIV